MAVHIIVNSDTGENIVAFRAWYLAYDTTNFLNKHGHGKFHMDTISVRDRVPRWISAMGGDESCYLVRWDVMNDMPTCEVIEDHRLDADGDPEKTGETEFIVRLYAKSDAEANKIGRDKIAEFIGIPKELLGVKKK